VIQARAKMRAVAEGGTETKLALARYRAEAADLAAKRAWLEQ
jgi:hypothetical protein